MLRIKENKLHHILGVARKCYEIAKEEGRDECFCRRVFLAGWLHDIGYEFAEQPDEHAKVGKNILRLVAKDERIIEAVGEHESFLELPVNDELRIVIMADLTTDTNGKGVPVECRLYDIGKRYGETSEMFRKCCEMAHLLSMTDINYFSEHHLLNESAPSHCQPAQTNGISEETLHHAIALSRKCYNLAKEKGMSESFCRKMFLCGWLYDVGCEFSDQFFEQRRISEYLAEKELACTDRTILDAMNGTANETYESKIFHTACTTIDYCGRDVPPEVFFYDLKERCGKDSPEYNFYAR